MGFPDERTDYTNALSCRFRAMEALAPRLWAYKLHNSVLMGLRCKRISKADAKSFWRPLKPADTFDRPTVL
jgi:hypothetical protein